jgi:hypothetical protein
MKNPFSKYVRPFIAFSMVVMIGYGFFTKIIGPEYIMGLATGILGSYFEGGSGTESGLVNGS